MSILRKSTIEINTSLIDLSGHRRPPVLHLLLHPEPNPAQTASPLLALPHLVQPSTVHHRPLPPVVLVLLSVAALLPITRSRCVMRDQLPPELPAPVAPPVPC